MQPLPVWNVPPWRPAPGRGACRRYVRAESVQGIRVFWATKRVWLANRPEISGRKSSGFFGCLTSRLYPGSASAGACGRRLGPGQHRPRRRNRARYTYSERTKCECSNTSSFFTRINRPFGASAGEAPADDPPLGRRRGAGFLAPRRGGDRGRYRSRRKHSSRSGKFAQYVRNYGLVP